MGTAKGQSGSSTLACFSLDAGEPRSRYADNITSTPRRLIPRLPVPLETVWGVDSAHTGLSFTELKTLNAHSIFLKHCSHTVAVMFIV